MAKGDLVAGRDQVETAILRELALADGKLSPAARILPADTDPRLLRLFSLPPGEATQQLLGYVDEDGAWHPGEAMLTDREAQAMYLLLEGMDLVAIRNAMDQRRRRRGLPLSIRTVEDHLTNARRKLRELFLSSNSVNAVL